MSLDPAPGNRERDPNPSKADPQKVPARSGGGPEVPIRRSAITQARSRLVECFTKMAQQEDRRLLSGRQESEWAAAWDGALRDFLLRNLEDSSAADAISLRILGVGESDDGFCVLACLEREDSQRGVFLSGGNLVELGVGAHVAHLMSIPRELTSDAFSEEVYFEGGNAIAFIPRIFLDPRSLEIESRRFTGGDLEGLFGVIFLDLLGESEEYSNSSWSINRGIPSVCIENGHAYECSALGNAPAIFEVSLDPRDFSITASLRPVTDPDRESDLDPGENLDEQSIERMSLEDALAEQGYAPALVDSDSPQQDADFFEEDLRNVWKRWDASVAWRVELAAVFKPVGGGDEQGDNHLLLHVFVRDDFGNCYLPFVEGEGALKSQDLVGFLVRATYERSGADTGRYIYEPGVLTLPGELSLENFLELHLPELPSTYIGAAMLAAAKKALDADELRWREKAPYAVLIPTDPEPGVVDEEGTFPTVSFARVLCFTSRGAHLMNVREYQGGLVIIDSSVVPTFFFPELGPPELES